MPNSSRTPFTVVVDGISVDSLYVTQCFSTVTVYNTGLQFATGDSTGNPTFIKDTSNVAVTAVNVSGDSSRILWQIDRDPSDPADYQALGLPTLSATAGGQTSFLPSVPGNFRLIAWVDTKGNGIFDATAGELLFAVLFAIVRITPQPGGTFLTDLQYLLTSRLDLPVSGMSLEAIYLVEGGGPNRAIGASKISIGNIGNLTSETLVITYTPTGTAKEIAGAGMLPMLDTTRTISPKGGISNFRRPSVCKPMGPPASGAGLQLQLTSNDLPDFIWPDRHPCTQSPFGSVDGGNGFREFVAAFSGDFPDAYARLSYADWFATPKAAATATITGAVLQPSTASTKMKLGTNSFAQSNGLVYDPSCAQTDTNVMQANFVDGSGGARPSGDLEDFALGQVVGGCLTGESLVLSGELLTASPKRGSPVRIRVLRTILGQTPVDANVDIPWAARGTSLKSGDLLARAWDRVRFAQRAPVMAVLTIQGSGGFMPGDPVVVTSRKRDFGIIAQLAAQSGRGDESLGDYQKLVDSLESAPNAALAGYLFARIWRRDAHRNPQLASKVVSRLIGSASVPPETWREMAERSVLFYSVVPGEVQDSVVRRFCELAHRTDDVHAGFAGFRGLGKIAGFAALSAIPVELATDLPTAYVRLVKSEGMKREPAFEKALSISIE